MFTPCFPYDYSGDGVNTRRNKCSHIASLMTTVVRCEHQEEQVFTPCFHYDYSGDGVNTRRNKCSHLASFMTTLVMV